MMGTHWVAEVYSNTHESWVCQDLGAGQGQTCVYFREGAQNACPMSALELHQAILSGDITNLYSDITDSFGRRSEPLSDMPVVVHVQAEPSFGLLLGTHPIEHLGEGIDQCFDGALWFTVDGSRGSPFTMQSARVGDVEPSMNQLRIIAQQGIPAPDEALKILGNPDAQKLAKVELQLEHTCPNLRCFLIHVGTSREGDDEETDGETVELSPQQLPMVLWLPRGCSTITARAVNTFGIEVATAALDLLCSLRPEKAASMIQSAARGYLVRHSRELLHLRQALARMKAAPEPLPVQKAVTQKRSFLTTTVNVQEDSSTSHVIYTVCVFDGGQLLRSVPRRYSEFHTLRAKVLEVLRGHFMGESASLIQFPPKATVRGKTSDKLTQQRAQMLQCVNRPAIVVCLTCLGR